MRWHGTHCRHKARETQANKEAGIGHCTSMHSLKVPQIAIMLSGLLPTLAAAAAAGPALGTDAAKRCACFPPPAPLTLLSPPPALARCTAAASEASPIMLLMKANMPSAPVRCSRLCCAFRCASR